MKLNRHIYPHCLKKCSDGLWHLENKSGKEICEPFKLKRAGNAVLNNLTYDPRTVVRDRKGTVIALYLYISDEDTLSHEYHDRLSILGNLNIKQI